MSSGADDANGDRVVCHDAGRKRGCQLTPRMGKRTSWLSPPWWLHVPKTGSSFCTVLMHALCPEAFDGYRRFYHVDQGGKQTQGLPKARFVVPILFHAGGQTQRKRSSPGGGCSA